MPPLLRRERRREKEREDVAFWRDFDLSQGRKRKGQRGKNQGAGGIRRRLKSLENLKRDFKSLTEFHFLIPTQIFFAWRLRVKKAAPSRQGMGRKAKEVDN